MKDVTTQRIRSHLHWQWPAVNKLVLIRQATGAVVPAIAEQVTGAVVTSMAENL
jgi:hypothetical protein